MSPSNPPPDAELRAWLDAGLDRPPRLGPRRRASLETLFSRWPRRRDALLHLPRARDDLRPLRGAELVRGASGAFRFVAGGAARDLGRHGRRLDGRVDGVPLTLLWFRPPPKVLLDRVVETPGILLSGALETDASGGLVCAHPRVHATPATGHVAVVYAGLDRATGRLLQRAVALALADWPEPSGDAERRALAVLHGLEDGDVETARRHLAGAEWAIFRAGLRAAAAAGGGRAEAISPPGRLARALVRRLPFAPTPSQAEAHAAIRGDLASGRAMRRVVNGDVGSGKTLVAALAVADVVEAGRQAVVLAPSETLARQHARTFHDWLAPLGVEVGLLTGSLAGRARAPLLASLRAGSTHLVVGTHALLSQGVDMATPGLAVIDEQHRFGVDQRGRLGAKAPGLHALALTATPIPRTLAWMLQGALAVSRLDPRPGTGANITTRAIEVSRLEELEDRLAAALDDGARAFWICASIDGTPDEAGVSARHARLTARLGERVAMLTGRQDPALREAALTAFRRGASPLLVATSVVEVGIDVPDASIIVVEGAERFGLAQLHQLRGRVGRAGQPASCVLLHGGALGPEQHARLDLLRRCHDGLALAEVDLERRGAGELLGWRQSGALAFRAVDPAADAAWLRTAPTTPTPTTAALFADQTTGSAGLASG